MNSLTVLLLLEITLLIALMAPIYIGAILFKRGLYRQALPWWQWCYRLSRVIRSWRALMSINMGACLEALGEFVQARPYLEEALRETEKGYKRRLRPVALINMAILLLREGDFDRAEQLLDEAFAARRLSRQVRTILLIDAAAVYINKGRFAEAMRLLEEGMAVSKKPDVQAIALTNLSACHFYQGHLDEALTLIQRAAQQPARLPWVSPYVTGVYIGYLAEAGRWDEAQEMEAKLLPDVAVLPPYLQTTAFRSIARLALCLGKLDRARDYAERAYPLNPNPNAQADSLLLQAEVFAARHNAQRATQLCEEILRLNALEYHKQRAANLLRSLHPQTLSVTVEPFAARQGVESTEPSQQATLSPPDR